MNVLVVQYLVTMPELTKILRVFKQRKHSGKGYFFEVQDLGSTMLKATVLPGLKPYRPDIINLGPSSLWWHENAYLLRVYRDVPAP